MSGYFTCHLPSFSLMHVHWSIDSPNWEKIVSGAVTDIYGDPVLFIKVMKLHGNEWIQDQQVDVFGKNNHWIISIGTHLHGSTIKVLLATIIEEGQEMIIFESDPIALPVSPEQLQGTIPSYTKDIRDINNIHDSCDDKRISS